MVMPHNPYSKFVYFYFLFLAFFGLKCQSPNALSTNPLRGLLIDGVRWTRPPHSPYSIYTPFSLFLFLPKPHTHSLSLPLYLSAFKNLVRQNHKQLACIVA